MSRAGSHSGSSRHGERQGHSKAIWEVTEARAWPLAGCGGGRDAQASGSCFWEMGWVEQVWKRRHVQVGRQLGSHEFEESVEIPVEMPWAYKFEQRQ